MTRLEQQMAFIEEIDKIKHISRQTYLADRSRQENDAEHSWHIALMAILLSEYANEEIDVLKTVTMLLIHDIVEIDAGDTPAYDTEGAKTQKARETAAAERIFGILPPEQGKKLRALWEEFDAKETSEAKFANAMDKIQPTMLNNATNGVSWREHGIALSQLLKRNSSTADGSKELWNYALEHFIAPHVEKGNLIKDVELKRDDA